MQFHKEAVLMISTRRFDRGFPALQQFVNVFLPAVRLNTLMEISLRINEPDSKQWNTQIARFLAMVAGQNAQAPRINRQ